MALYDEVEAFAKKRGAIYIGARSVARMALTSLKTTLEASEGQINELAIPPFAARLDGATKGILRPDALKFETNHPDIFLSSTEELSLDFSLGVLDAGAWAATLTRFQISLRNIKFEILATDTQLLCSAGEASVIPTFQREPDFDATLATYGIDPQEATRVEGMLLYSGLVTAITKPLSNPQKIDLARLYPGVRFDGFLEVGVTSSNDYLLITGRNGVLHQPGCECADVGDGMGSTQPGTSLPNPGADVENGEPGGNLTIGGPTPVPITSGLLGRRGGGIEDAGLFVSNEMARAIVEGPFPAIRLDIRDNGFIGWKATAIVDFSDFDFIADLGKGAFYVELKFRAEVYGSIHVDLGKLGKIRVTNFSAEQGSPGANSVRVGFYFVLGTEGLYLKPVLEDVNFGDFEVFLRLGTLVGTPFGGWGAVIGYIFDVILAELIAWQIPIQLESELRAWMAKAMITLIERSYSAEVTGLSLRYRPNLLRALYQGGSEGFLVSIGADG